MNRYLSSATLISFAYAAAMSACLLSGCSKPTAVTTASHIPDRVTGAEDLGPLTGDQTLDLVIGLKLHDADQISNNPVAISPETFGDRFAPSANDYVRLRSFFIDRGLTISRETSSRSSMSVQGSAHDVGLAFNTEIHLYQKNGAQFFAPTREPIFDAQVADLIVGVIGLDDAAPFRAFTHSPTPKPSQPHGFNEPQTPTDLQTLYNGTGVAEKGAGETVAILGTGLPPDPQQDVAAYITKYFSGVVNQKAQYVQIFLGGQNLDPPQFAQSEQIENILDVEMVMALAPATNIVQVLAATNAPGLFSDGVTYVINNLPQAHAVTVSYGICERYTASEILVLDQMFQQAKAQGQQWFFATGDNGTNDCQDGTGAQVIAVDWPASSEYVIGVGGTALDADIGTEYAWGGAGGGGGGQSEIISKPAFQMGVGPYPNDGVRDLPDVAALAGSPCLDTTQGAAEGTSAATPMWAGVWVRLDQHLGGHGITNGAEVLYATAKAHSNAFNDITVGENNDGQSKLPGYQAQPGYDLATGWGSPNIANLLSQWGH